MLVLEALPRDKKDAPKDGFLKAVFYGAHTPSTPIFVNSIAFDKALREAGESTTLTLDFSGSKLTALIHDVQRHPVKYSPSHVDFYIVEKGQKVHVNVPLEFIGEAPATKSGGILVKVIHELSVQGDSQHLPHSLSVDLSTLTASDSVITAKDITLPPQVSLYHVSDDEVIASIAVAKDEAETPTSAPDLSAIEVEKKGKKEEEKEA